MIWLTVKIIGLIRYTSNNIHGQSKYKEACGIVKQLNLAWLGL